MCIDRGFQTHRCYKSYLSLTNKTWKNNRWLCWYKTGHDFWRYGQNRNRNVPILSYTIGLQGKWIWRLSSVISLASIVAGWPYVQFTFVSLMRMEICKFVQIVKIVYISEIYDATLFLRCMNRDNLIFFIFLANGRVGLLTVFRQY